MMKFNSFRHVFLSSWIAISKTFTNGLLKFLENFLYQDNKTEQKNFEWPT